LGDKMNWSKLRRDRAAEIQGMPLVIIIMVIVAVIVLGIIIGWFVFFDDDDISKQLNIDKDGLPTVGENDQYFELNVTDAEKNPVTDATVHATGSGVDAFGTHQGGGKYRIDLAGLNLYGEPTGTITVEVEKSGYTKDTCNIVVRKA